ncbi:hypothetical protein HFO63_18250 [Rhizobium laguerreae]|uniref:hypothetical protein n=1 Tax=Rhizobium laguerreae TaxID=1076926 RepID=UPI001C90A9EB|nr:hypothetical protein [Rhizobium laguerreae]MBY3083071.1 hypothetical protein [Rhizobium laguerreae]MBY3147495.1 hypothetical protein [Rhizobium laguerreae]
MNITQECTNPKKLFTTGKPQFDGLISLACPYCREERKAIGIIRGEGSAAWDCAACAAGIEPAYQKRAEALEVAISPSSDYTRNFLK